MVKCLYDLLEGNTPLEAAKDLLADYDGLMCARKGNKYVLRH